MAAKSSKHGEKELTALTVRVTSNLNKAIKHRLADTGESFQDLAVRLLISETSLGQTVELPAGSNVVSSTNANGGNVSELTTSDANDIEYSHYAEDGNTSIPITRELRKWVLRLLRILTGNKLAAVALKSNLIAFEGVLNDPSVRVGPAAGTTPDDKLRQVEELNREATAALRDTLKARTGRKDLGGRLA